MDIELSVADPNDPLAESLVEQLKRELETRGLTVKPRTSVADMLLQLEESNEQLKLEPPGLSEPYYAPAEDASTKKARRTEAAKSALQRRQLRLQRRGRKP